MDTFQTGAHYHLVHSLAIMIAGIINAQDPEVAQSAPIGAFVVGILLFSGSLYFLAITGVRAFGAITPIGGICLLAAWALLAAGTIKNSRM